MLRSEIISQARVYLGTPHVHQGRVGGPNGAMDCAGLLIVVGKDLGVVPPDFDFVHYNEINDGSELISILEVFCTEIDNNDAQPGDIFVASVMGNPQHCGFYSDYGIIHSLTKVVEHRLNDKWRSRIVRSYRLIGVENG